jgi:hypothetical protein
MAKSSNSYPGLGTLYKIIHLRTKNLEEFDWGKQWINASEGKDTHRPNKLNEKVKPQEIIQYYPPPYQPWQEEEGIITPLCFNVYENPKPSSALPPMPAVATTAKTATTTAKKEGPEAKKEGTATTATAAAKKEVPEAKKEEIAGGNKCKQKKTRNKKGKKKKGTRRRKRKKRTKN